VLLLLYRMGGMAWYRERCMLNLCVFTTNERGGERAWHGIA
jgi:hypothetical protein